jgi:hypothetical protein
MEKAITPTLNVATVGDYQPSPFRPNGYKKGVRPGRLAIK